MPSDSVRQVTTTARAFSLSRLRATAPSRREPTNAAACPCFCCLIRSAARDEERLPPGGSWQRRKVLTEGERGSNIAVESREYGLVSPPHLRIRRGSPRRGMGCMWTGCCRRQTPFDLVSLVMTAARAFSLSRLRATAPSRREPGFIAARLYSCCLIRPAARGAMRQSGTMNTPHARFQNRIAVKEFIWYNATVIERLCLMAGMYENSDATIPMEMRRNATGKENREEVCSVRDFRGRGMPFAF